MVARTHSILAAAACVLATTTNAETFAFDTAYAAGMATLDLELLIDAPIAPPVYIGANGLCHQNDALFAVALDRIEQTDIPIGLVEVTRQQNGTVTDIIPEYKDPFYGNDQLGTLWTLLTGIPCEDRGALTAGPAALLPVTSLNGATSMSALLETFTANE